MRWPLSAGHNCRPCRSQPKSHSPCSMELPYTKERDHVQIMSMIIADSDTHHEEDDAGGREMTFDQRPEAGEGVSPVEGGGPRSSLRNRSWSSNTLGMVKSRVSGAIGDMGSGWGELWVFSHPWSHGVPAAAGTPPPSASGQSDLRGLEGDIIYATNLTTISPVPPVCQTLSQAPFWA